MDHRHPASRRSPGQGNLTEVLVLAAVFVAACFLVSYGWMFRCPFKLLTGLDCPGCGFQRALRALLKGDIVGAARYNFFLLYAIPYLLLVIAGKYVLKGRVGQEVRRFAEHRYTIWFYVVSFLAWFVVRNVMHI